MVNDREPDRTRWRRTWEDVRERDDFSYTPRDWHRPVGRILKTVGGPSAGEWFWSMYEFGPGIKRTPGSMSGQAATAKEAAVFVEQAWEKATTPAAE